MSCLQQRLSQNHPCPCNPAPSRDHNGEGGENVFRPEDLAFIHQDQTKLIRQRSQKLEAALRDQQQESHMWQKRLDLVPDQVLCNECIEDKDDAHYAGKVLHWVPSPVVPSATAFAPVYRHPCQNTPSPPPPPPPA